MAGIISLTDISMRVWQYLLVLLWTRGGPQQARHCYLSWLLLKKSEDHWGGRACVLGSSVF
jgi:hypothetical protein